MIKQCSNLTGRAPPGSKLKYKKIVNHNNFHFKISQAKTSEKILKISMGLKWVLFSARQILYKIDWKHSSSFLCRPVIFQEYAFV